MLDWWFKREHFETLDDWSNKDTLTISIFIQSLFQTLSQTDRSNTKFQSKFYLSSRCRKSRELIG